MKTDEGRIKDENKGLFHKAVKVSEDICVRWIALKNMLLRSAQGSIFNKINSNSKNTFRGRVSSD